MLLSINLIFDFSALCVNKQLLKTFCSNFVKSLSFSLLRARCSVHVDVFVAPNCFFSLFLCDKFVSSASASRERNHKNSRRSHVSVFLSRVRRELEYTLWVQSLPSSFPAKEQSELASPYLGAELPRQLIHCDALGNRFAPGECAAYATQHFNRRRLLRKHLVAERTETDDTTAKCAHRARGVLFLSSSPARRRAQLHRFLFTRRFSGPESNAFLVSAFAVASISTLNRF